ncbi:MAG: zinc finger CCCH domain-containing protein [archaeon]|nr:zinc finger CCCH domain-containing protein [archaeon]
MISNTTMPIQNPQMPNPQFNPSMPYYYMRPQQYNPMPMNGFMVNNIPKVNMPPNMPPQMQPSGQMPIPQNMPPQMQPNMPMPMQPNIPFPQPGMQMPNMPMFFPRMPQPMINNGFMIATNTRNMIFAPPVQPFQSKVNMEKYKTKPCRYYHSSTGCTRGDGCIFIHDPNYKGREIPNFDLSNYQKDENNNNQGDNGNNSQD